MAQIQRQGESFTREDLDDSLSLELELQKLRSTMNTSRESRHGSLPLMTMTTVNGQQQHTHTTTSLYSDHRTNGAIPMPMPDLYNTNGSDAQEQARRLRNQMILAKIQEIERNFMAAGLERQRKLDAMRREHEALIRKYRPMQLLYRHIGVTETYPQVNTNHASSNYSVVPEMKSTGVNTMISGPVAPISSPSDKKRENLESTHSSVNRRIKFFDDDDQKENEGRAKTEIILNENSNERRPNSTNNKNNNRTDAQLNEPNNNGGDIIKPLNKNLEQSQPRLIDKYDRSTDDDETEDNALPLAQTSSGIAAISEDEEETSEITSVSAAAAAGGGAAVMKKHKCDSEPMKMPTAVVNLSTDSSFTTFPSTHTNTTTSYDLRAPNNSKQIVEKRSSNNRLKTDYRNAPAATSSLEILDGPGLETMEDVQAEVEIHEEEEMRKQKRGANNDSGAGAAVDDNEDENTTSAAGESIVMDSTQNLKTPDSLPRDELESDLVNLITKTEHEWAHVGETKAEVVKDPQQEVKNRTRNAAAMINEDHKDDWESEDERREHENQTTLPPVQEKEEEVHTLFTTELLPTSASDVDVEPERPFQESGTGLQKRMDKEMNLDYRNEFSIERHSNVLNSGSIGPSNYTRSEEKAGDDGKAEGNENENEIEIIQAKAQTDEMNLNESFSNDSGSEAKKKENVNAAQDSLFPTVSASAVDPKGNKKFRRIKLNYDDSEESDISEFVGSGKRVDKKQDERGRTGTKQNESPFTPTQVLGMGADTTTNLITDSDLAKMVEKDSDFDDFFA